MFFVVPCVVVPLVCGGQTQPPQRFEYEELMLGSQVRIVFYVSDQRVANEAAAAAMARIAELDQILSNYRSDSELMTVVEELNRMTTAGPADTPIGPVSLSADLGKVMAAASEWHDRSGGIFDPTVAPLTRLWKRAIRRRAIPNAERLDTARQQVGFRRLQLKASGRAVQLNRADGVPIGLDLGGIAKGYIADQVLSRAKETGNRSCPGRYWGRYCRGRCAASSGRLADWR